MGLMSYEGKGVDYFLKVSLKSIQIFANSTDRGCVSIQPQPWAATFAGHIYRGVLSVPRSWLFQFVGSQTLKIKAASEYPMQPTVSHYLLHVQQTKQEN